MTILYSYKEGNYINLNDVDYNKPETIPENIYVNITNKCPCRCSFCIREEDSIKEFDELWLKTEPTVKEVIDEFEKVDLSKYSEIIFCGYGEPLTRLNEVINISKYLKSREDSIKIRINTNGLGDLINKTDAAKAIGNYIDSVSISLNASNKEKYLEITKSSFGIDSFEGMIKFAVNCKKYIDDVALSVVDIIGEEEINKCKELCNKYDLKIKIRQFR